MSDFTRNITGFRYAQTLYGDTLQKIAARELGDAAQWATLAWLNELRPPYLTDHAELAGSGVLVTGSTIKLPAASAEVDAATNPDEVFLVDCQLVGGQFQFENGDIAIVAGRANLRQALGHSMVTNHGELLFHQTYGANLGRLKGSVNGPALELVAQEYVEDALRDDTRVQSVTMVTSSTQGDQLSINAEVVPISGVNLNISKVI